jgi:hypothetical protein
MKPPVCVLFGCVAFLWPLQNQQSAADLYRLEIADCDDVAFGPEGDLYLACHSPEDRLKIPVRGAKSPADVMDAYVLRFNPEAGKLIYATRFGGSSYDAALRVEVDNRGYAYATGLTKSPEFRVTADAIQKKFGGGDSDAFLVELAPDGQISYASFLGGSSDDVGNGLDLGADQSLYIGGTTSSDDLPSQQGPKPSSGGADAFLCRVRPRDKASACRVFGGRLEEKLTGVALDNKGGIYTAGYTKSADFPIKDPLQRGLRGESDLFLTRLSSSGLEITFSTFFGGSGDDSGWGVAIGRNGNPVVAGITDSVDLPGTLETYQPENGGNRDAFIASFGRPHREFRATYFGGPGDDESGYDGSNIPVDGRGNFWIAGITVSADLPTRNPSQPRFGGGNGDGFVASFSPDLERLCFSTYHGGPERDLLEGLAISAAGRIAATGVSLSDKPSAYSIRLSGAKLQAGAFLVSFRGNEPCAH